MADILKSGLEIIGWGRKSIFLIPMAQTRFILHLIGSRFHRIFLFQDESYKSTNCRHKAQKNSALRPTLAIVLGSGFQQVVTANRKSTRLNSSHPSISYA